MNQNCALTIATMHRNTDIAQRMEPCGFDGEENIYILLDDNRLYRRTEMKIPPATRPMKASVKKRSTKRRRLTGGEAADTVEDQDQEATMLDSMKWSCVCATIDEFAEFIATLKKSKHPDEKEFYKHLVNEVMPVLQAVEEV